MSYYPSPTHGSAALIWPAHVAESILQLET
jgi:hypothetical protein